MMVTQPPPGPHPTNAVVGFKKDGMSDYAMNDYIYNQMLHLIFPSLMASLPMSSRVPNEG